MNFKSKGEYSEVAVAKRLYELGATVLFPFGESSAYDLCADWGDEIERIQVKTGNHKDGCVIGRLERTRYNSNGASSEGYNADEIDAFIIYSDENDTCYHIDVDDAPNTQVRFRLSEPANNQSVGIRFASDYELASK